MNEKIEQIKDAIRNLMQMITSRGEPLSEEMKLQLAKVLQHAKNRIQELQQTSLGPESAPIEPLQPATELQPGPYPSSNINSFKYNPENKQLFVKFHGKDTADSGPIYSYQGIPAFIFEVFRRGAVGPKTSGQNKYHRWFKGVTPSLGAAMNALIKKGGYPYQKVA